MHLIADNSNKFAHLDESKEIPKEKINEIITVFNKYWGDTIGQMNGLMSHTQLMLLVQKAFYYEFDPFNYPDHCDIFSGQGKINYEKFRYEFFNAGRQIDNSDYQGYSGLITILFRMAFVLKRVNVKITIDKRDYDNDIAKGLELIQDENFLDATNGWTNAESELLFSLYEIRRNTIEGVPSLFNDVMRYINHFRTSEWASDSKLTESLKKTGINKKLNEDHWQTGPMAERDGLLPASGSIYTTDQNDPFIIEALNGILDRYLANQEMYPGHLVGKTLGIKIPDLNTTYWGPQSYFVNSYQYCTELLRDALYIEGYTNSYSDTDDAWKQFKQDHYLDQAINVENNCDKLLRTLFRIKSVPDSQITMRDTKINTNSDLNDMTLLSHTAVQAAYLAPDNNKLTLVRYNNKSNTNQIYQIDSQNIFDKQTELNLSYNDLLGTIDSKTGGHTQTLAPSGNNNQYFIGTAGQKTTSSDILWAQEIMRVTLVPGEINQNNQNILGAPKIININKLVKNSTRVEANTNLDTNEFVLFINTSDNKLYIFSYVLSEINNMLDAQNTIDITKIHAIKQAQYSNFNKIAKSIQGYAFDANFIYVASQFAPKMPQTGSNTYLLEVTNWPRKIVCLPWKVSNTSQIKTINLTSDVFMPSGLNYNSHRATELEGIQVTNNKLIMPYVVHDPYAQDLYQRDQLHVCQIESEDLKQLASNT